MSQALSRLLGAREPLFSLSLRQLEQASGRPSADVRLATEIAGGAKDKLRQLWLDPDNTTGEELYAVLKQRVIDDDARLVEALESRSSLKNASQDNLALVAEALKSVPLPKTCFALKSAVARRLLKGNPPKQAMKQLGYRSLDSMLKHETPAGLFALGWLVESATWRRGATQAFKGLSPTDFEVREIAVIYTDSKRWQKLADTLVEARKHNIISVKLLGAVVLLPLPAKRPPAVTVTTTALVLQAMNEIRAASTYLKLCQVKPDFGACVQTVVADEPRLNTHLLDQPVSWHVIQRYYARFNHALRAELFEPHIQAEDLTWHSLEKVLSHLEPSFEFWHDSANLAILSGRQPVSLNLLDAALNACNQLPYSHRLVRYFRHSLWHELALRYLKHDKIEQSVVSGLQTELASEPALI